MDDGRGGNACGRGPSERPLPHAPALPSSGGTSLRLSAGPPRARALSLSCPPASRCALRPGRGGGARFCRRRHLAVPRGRLLVLPALLPAPGTCPWPPRNDGRGLGGRGWVVTLPRALWSTVGSGALRLAQVRPPPARLVRRWEVRRAAARRPLDTVPRERTTPRPSLPPSTSQEGLGGARPRFSPRVLLPALLPRVLVGCQVHRERGRRRSPQSLLVLTYPVVLAETQARAGWEALRQLQNGE